VVVILILFWGEDFSSPLKFSDVLSAYVAKVSLGEARRHISQGGLLNQNKMLGYGASPWPEYN